MVFYRKYRPQTLEEVVGQDHIKQSLFKAVEANRVAHAYLFSGPRGTGKTSTARILAKIVNCHSEKSRPCNKCESCQTITDGTSLDLVEIDGASNRGIEDVRALRENIKLAPTRSKKKVYIIDEVHMLTTEAFNALLKTLEEPPSHVLFILATTDPQKLPLTILSRVQRLDFKLAGTRDLIKVISEIVQKENLQIDNESIKLIAKKAQGSFRDGAKILDQVSTLGAVTPEGLEALLLGSMIESSIKILKAVASGTPERVLGLVTEELTRGVPAKEITLSLLEVARMMMLIKYNLGDSLVREEIGQDEYQSLVELAQIWDVNRIVSTMDRLSVSLERLRYASIPSLPLEIALMESSPDRIGVGESAPIGSESEDTGQITQQASSPDLQKIAEKWSYILETAKSYNYSLEALLRSAKVVSCERDVVIVEVPYSFHQRMLEAPKSKDMLESILSDILSRSIKISTVIGQRPQSKEDLQNVEVAPDDELVRLAAEIFSSDSVN